MGQSELDVDFGRAAFGARPKLVSSELAGRRFTVASLRYPRRALRNQCACEALAPRLFDLGEHFIVPHSGHNKMLRVARSIGPDSTITPLFGVIAPRAAPDSGRCTRLEGQVLALDKRSWLRPRWPMPAMPPASTSRAGQPAVAGHLRHYGMCQNVQLPACCPKSRSRTKLSGRCADENAPTS